MDFGEKDGLTDGSDECPVRRISETAHHVVLQITFDELGDVVEAHSYCVSGHRRGRSLPHRWKAGGTGHSRYSKGSVSLSMILSDARLTQTAPWNGGFSPPPDGYPCPEHYLLHLRMSPDGIIIGSTKRFRPSQGMQSRAFPPSGDPCRNRLFPPYYPAWLRSVVIEVA